jgi:GGDEF domain-containing protein
MITLSPYLKARTGMEDALELRVQALQRVVSVLLQGMALNAFNYDTAAYHAFGNALRGLRAGFEGAPDEASAMLVAGEAIRLLDEYNMAAGRYLMARQEEVGEVISLLSETVLDIAKAGPEVMVLVKEIERDISLATRLDTIGVARERLADCLEHLRANVSGGLAGSQSTPEHGTDPVTGLPDANGAAEAISRIWGRRMEHYVAVITAERLDSVNLRFGSQAGDQTLRSLSRHIARQLGTGDCLFRGRGSSLILLMERHQPEALVASELARVSPGRIDSAIRFRDREVMIPVPVSWDLFALRTQSRVEDLLRRLNESVAGSSGGARKAAAAGR